MFNTLNVREHRTCVRNRHRVRDEYDKENDVTFYHYPPCSIIRQTHF